MSDEYRGDKSIATCRRSCGFCVHDTKYCGYSNSSAPIGQPCQSNLSSDDITSLLEAQQKLIEPTSGEPGFTSSPTQEQLRPGPLEQYLAGQIINHCSQKLSPKERDRCAPVL